LYGVFGHGRIHPFEFAQLFFEQLFGFSFPLFFCRFGAKLVDIFVYRVASQLILNGAHLLLQEVVALLLVDILFYFGLNLVFEFNELLLANQDFQQTT